MSPVNAVFRNVLLWIVIALVMVAVYSRYSSVNKGVRGTASANCLMTREGAVMCPPPGGSIVLDETGNPVCGRGQCLRGSNDQWMCSTEVGGHAGFKGSAGIACTGGCEAAAHQLCEIAK
jgi:hypothetical protein